MNRVHYLEHRLAQIAAVLDADPAGLALLGLGSVGLETDRLDQWSDLDFFAIVSPGSKARFIDDTAWLSKAHPLAYAFRNTADGYKLLFADGIFAEMAVFEPAELAGIPFAPGRTVWHRPGFDCSVLTPVHPGGRLGNPPSLDYALGEMLTCLYVGLCRWHRGERLSAWRFIQSYCLDRVLEMAQVLDQPRPGHADPYNRDRRFEQRYPDWEPVVVGLLQGIEQVPESARFLVEWADGRFGVNQALKAEILRLS